MRITPNSFAVYHLAMLWLLRKLRAYISVGQPTFIPRITIGSARAIRAVVMPLWDSRFDPSNCGNG